MAESSYTDEIEDGYISLIKNTINTNKIKLWLEPYFVDGKSNDEKILQLANSLAPTLELEDLTINRHLKTLQSRALDKLKARKELAESGTIRLRPKFSKEFDLGYDLIKSLRWVEVPKEATGSDLVANIADLIDCEAKHLKLISSGKVIRSDIRILDQKIPPGSSVMIIKVEQDSTLQIIEDQQALVADTKKDAELLGSFEMLSVEAQNGQTFEFSKESENKLFLALSFHEKGKAALRRSDLNMALVLLLEADRYYNEIESNIMDKVDNYGILNLDIVWCYVKLGLISNLEDGVVRLNKCERILTQLNNSYKHEHNLESGNDVMDQALFMRMHVLQAVAHFHSGDLIQAKKSLLIAIKEFNELFLDPDDIQEAIANGYTESEAVISLRACGRHLGTALNYARKRRNKRERIAEEEKERSKLRSRYGKTLNGNFVNIGHVKTLMNMGYQEEYVVAALRKSNNNIGMAIDLILNDPDELDNLMVLFSDPLEKNVENAIKALTEKYKDIKLPIKGINKHKRENEMEKAKKEAYDRFKCDLKDSYENHNGGFHLGATLEEDENLIKMYSEIIGVTFKKAGNYHFINQ